MKQASDRDLHAISRIVLMGILSSAIVVLAARQMRGITSPHSGMAVTTYHYNTLRTGWDQQESDLNYTNVNSSALSVLPIRLDDVNDQVDAQPLVVPDVQISEGKHDVVYVATEGNNIYALDADTGARLNKVNLGPPVPRPLGCTMTFLTVGINGTPVVDLPAGTMYVINYGLDSSKRPAYFIHALDLATLTDKVPPVRITASHQLSDGRTFSFNAALQRQEPGLLLANGNVYAGFGGFCDYGAEQARGWVLGFQAGSLTPLPAGLVTNALVWMSGYGIAGDQNGNIYFSTGSSDLSGTTYDGAENIANRVVRLNPDLTRPPSSKLLFTPANIAPLLDKNNRDVGSGGVMLLPPQSGPFPNMLVATSKDGRMVLLNRDQLGGSRPNDVGALAEVTIGGECWCGPSYFNDGNPHIVSSAGTAITSHRGQAPYTQNTLGLWDLQASPQPMLTQRASGKMPDTMQDAGFFTTVSSNGQSNPIIWAVSRPKNSQSPNIWLYAFKATPAGDTLPLLFQSVAGSWPVGNANIVPVVANGKVYVASYRELDIFGLNRHKR